MSSSMQFSGRFQLDGAKFGHTAPDEEERRSYPKRGYRGRMRNPHRHIQSVANLYPLCPPPSPRTNKSPNYSERMSGRILWRFTVVFIVSGNQLEVLQ